MSFVAGGGVIMQFLGNCVRAINPLARNLDEDQARMAARAGSVALVGTALQSIVSTVFQRSNPEEVKRLMIIAAGPASRDVTEVNEILYSQIAPMLTTLLWFVTIMTILVCGALAWVQWRKMTQIIPLLYLGVVVLCMMGMLGVLMDPNKRVLASDSATISQWAVTVILAVVMLAAYRGAKQYHALQGSRT